MRRALVTTLACALAFPVAVRAAEPSAALPDANCTCAAAFEKAVAMVEADYAGFMIKVGAGRREAYDRFKALLQADAAGAGPDRCMQVLETYAAFFQDHHVFILRGGKGGEPAGVARPWTEAEARAEIDKNRERLDPFEGLWYSRTGRYAVLHEPGTPAGTLAAVRLAADGTPSRELAAVFRREARGGHRATFRDARGRWQDDEATLHRGGALLVFGIESWGRLHPAVASARLDPADPQAPVFARLDASTLYLSMPSFIIEAQPLRDLIKAKGDEIAKAHGLVIDLRGNVGGNGIYYDLLPYLLTGPIRFSEDSLILASPRNLHTLEEIRESAGQGGEVFDPALHRMRESPGKLVPFQDGETYTPPVVAPGPHRVALLVDRAVGSAAEALVLIARESPRVIVVGENTRGNIDYQQVTMARLGCGDHGYIIGTPLYTRNRSLPAGALDVAGITPDVPVPDSLADPLDFTVRLLAKD
jgi:Peptidase family S41